MDELREDVSLGNVGRFSGCLLVGLPKPAGGPVPCPSQLPAHRRGRLDTPPLRQFLDSSALRVTADDDVGHPQGARAGRQ